MRRSKILAALLGAAALAGCTVGPDYVRPDAPLQAHFKEADGWTPAHPVDAIEKGAWWSMFNDPVLDGLERQVATGNQTVKQFEAAYRQARQIVAEARASYFPTLGVDASAEREKSPAGLEAGSIGGGLGGTSTSTTTGASTGAGAGSSTGLGSTTSSETSTARSVYLGELEASWVPDLWGKVRRTVEGDKALAQADVAEVANAKLSAEASLAQDYFELRVLDEQARLDRDTVAAYQRYLDITREKYTEGNEARSAIFTAQSQLENAQATLASVGATRAQMEHAIAVLIGKPPAEFSLAPAPLTRDVPVAPAGVASTLLQRRPDIAAAERQAASANAQIGVAEAAFYPDLTLSGEYGFGATNLARLFDASSMLWSVGAEVTETIFDAGLRRAQVRAARAVYDQQVATYRQTVLAAFQGVEDQLAALRVYAQQQQALERSDASARQAVQFDLNEYQEGTVDYTTVVTAQATQFNTSLQVLTVLQQRLQASVLLVEDLGGGWSTAELSNPPRH